MMFEDLDPPAARELLRQHPETRVLDVRTQPEYERCHIEGAVLLPVQELQDRCAELDPGTNWLITCEHGVRSVMACEYLSALGFPKLYNLQGGMARWVAESLPVTH